jgi:hypothetical protein
MIPTDPKKKFFVFALLFLVFCGILYGLWILFFNQGQIIITAKAPYKFSVYKSTENSLGMPLTVVDCKNSVCSATVKPGNYQVIVEKNGYQKESRTITIAAREKYQAPVDFRFIPIISALGERLLYIFPSQAQAFTQKIENISLQIIEDSPLPLKNLPQKITDVVFNFDGKTAFVYSQNKVFFYKTGSGILQTLDVPGDTKFFPDGSGRVFFYVSRNKQNYRQTLYRQAFNANGDLEKPVMVTTFVRDLHEYFLRISPDGHKILLVEQDSQKSALYLIDLQKSERVHLLDHPETVIDAKWLPQGNDFLFQARGEVLYLYESSSGKTKKLDLRAPLSLLAFMNQDELIAAATFNVPISKKTEELEGQRMTADAFAVPFIFQDSQNRSLAFFLKYSLKSNEGTWLKAVPENKLPEVVELEKNILYFLQGRELYSLKFNED